MKIYLCDDEQKIREKICGAVTDSLPEAEMHLFDNGASLLEQIYQEPCEILLLDIDMPKLSGMEVAEQLCSMGVTVLLLGIWAGTDTVRACQAVILGSCTGACLTLLVLVGLKRRDSGYERLPMVHSAFSILHCAA